MRRSPLLGGFQARQSVLQVHGTCEDCREGRGETPTGGDHRAVVRARCPAHGDCYRAQWTRLLFAWRGIGPGHPGAQRIQNGFQAKRTEHLDTLEARYQELLAEETPKLESYPTFLFFKGAADGLFASGADELSGVVDDREALMIGIRCERASHQFFKKYGQRFEDSEGKRIFLEFADEEREHLELLIREYRALVARQEKSKPSAT